MIPYSESSTSIKLKTIVLLIVVVVLGCCSREVCCQQMFSNVLRYPYFSVVNAMARTPEGGAVIVGKTFSSSNESDQAGMIVKVSSTGQVLWSREIMTTGGLFFSGVLVLIDGGIICSGTTNVLGGDLVLLALSPEGKLGWNHRYHFNGNIYPVSQTQLSTGSIIITGGYSYSHEGSGFICSTTEHGELQWAGRISKSLPAIFPMTLMHAIEIDTVILLVGECRMLSNDPDPDKLLVLRCSRSGTLLDWRYYSLPDQSLLPKDIVALSDGSVVIGGSIFDPHSSVGTSPLIMRLRKDLTVHWAEKISVFSSAAIEQLLVAEQRSIIASISPIPNPALTVEPTVGSIAKFDSSGLLQVLQQLRSNAGKYTTSFLIPGRNGFYMGSGMVVPTNNDQLVGVFSLTPQLGGCNIEPRLVSSANVGIKDSTGDPLSMGNMGGSLVNDSVWIKTSILPTNTQECDENDITQPRSTILGSSSIFLVSNPVTANATIRLEIKTAMQQQTIILLRDLSGTVIYQMNRNTARAIEIPTTGLASGIYFVEVADATSFATLWRGKLIVE